MFRNLPYILLFLVLTGCKNAKVNLTEVDARQIAIADSLGDNADINAFINPYKKQIDKQMDRILSYSPLALSKTDTPYNTAIGNMEADAVMELANPIFRSRTGKNIDAVLLNYGGIRSSFPQGNVTMRTAYQLMPFENTLVVVELTGKKVREMFDYLKAGTAHPISGMRLKLNSTGDIEEERIRGKAVDTNATYFIATNDYLLLGGDNMNFFKNPVSVMDVNYKIRNILIDYFSKTDTLAPLRDDRFIKE